MTTHRPRRPIALLASLTALVLALSGAGGFGDVAVASGRHHHGAPIVWTDSGAVRGRAVDGADTFLGLPYAAPPTGRLRWRPPQPARRWRGVRDATEFGPSCPQQPGLFSPP